MDVAEVYREQQDYTYEDTNYRTDTIQDDAEK